MTSQFRSAVDLEVEKQLMLAQRDEMEADKLELQADRAEFRAEKLEWQVVTKSGSSSAKGPCDDCQAGLKAERLQLETEKTQLRVAQSQLKDAQSQLEATKSQLETAQTQLEKAREQMEIATKHLEAAKAQTDIDNTRLEAAKASLEAAKMRFGAAGKQLNAAKSRFEAAKTGLDLAASSIEAEKSHLQDEKASLEIKVSEMESKKAELEVRLSQLETDKFELGSELGESKAENKRLLEKMEGVVKQLEQCCKDKKALQGNPKVFLDITINGAKAGRVVIELYLDTSPICSESFRALCTGEKGINRNNGKPLHYKGSTFFKVYSSYIRGGNITSETDKEIHSDGLEFPAENFTRKHSASGTVGIANPNAGYSHKYEFDITTEKMDSWDNVYVVLGQVIEGMNVVMAIKNAGSGANCVIADCGQLE